MLLMLCARCVNMTSSQQRYLFAAGRWKDKHQQTNQRDEHARQNDGYHVVHWFPVQLQKNTKSAPYANPTKGNLAVMPQFLYTCTWVGLKFGYLQIHVGTKSVPTQHIDRCTRSIKHIFH